MLIAATTVLAGHHPEIDSYADVTRDHCLAWAQHLAGTPAETTGKPLGAASRIQRLSGLSQMFRDAAAWEYPDVPGFAPITSRDAPKLPQRIPRFIPDHELDLVMPVINQITCPFQRAALHAPRLKARLDIEQQLVQDAAERGWTREAERHTAFARRLSGLLTDLGEQAGPDGTPRREPGPCTSTG